MRRHLPLIGYLMLTVAFAATFYFGTPGSARKIERESKARDASIAAEAHERCLEGAKNRQALRGIVSRSLDLGKPGSPGYAYYQQHPHELKVALRRTYQALADLPPIHC